jgi:hypothetical protein
MRGVAVAELQVEGVELVLHLTKGEMAEVIHGDLRAPLTDVLSVEILDDAHDAADHGMKSDTRIPGSLRLRRSTQTGRDSLPRFIAARHAA